MPKKQMTAEERKAWGAKMKAAREAKRTADLIETNPPTVDNNDVSKLLKRSEELESRQFFSQPQQTPQPQAAIRSITKYSINPKDYPDPRERLSNETKLERHAFKHNFELGWKVGRVNYDKDGVHYVEP